MIHNTFSVRTVIEVHRITTAGTFHHTHKPRVHISNSFNQVAHRVNKGGKLYDEDIADMKERLEEVL